MLVVCFEVTVNDDRSDIIHNKQEKSIVLVYVFYNKKKGATKTAAPFLFCLENQQNHGQMVTEYMIDQDK